MVTSRNEVKILDFGVAKLSESSDLTKAGSTMGTAAYMSPEQSKGEDVDIRADVWSLGVVLYEMLAGRAPFEAGYEAALTYAIVNEDPPRLETLNPDVSLELADLVHKCLSKNPNDRFDHASTLALELEKFTSPSGTRFVETQVQDKKGDATPSNSSILARFGLTAASVLGVTWAAVAFIGLPNWVLPLALILLMIGIPSLLVAANQDRRRNEGRDIGGPFQWLTLKKAQWGGVYSISGLVLLTVAFMAMRTLGIGPFGSLQASGALHANAKILVSDFQNATNEDGLAGSVTELLRIALSQSDAITLMESSDVVSALLRMERDPNATIDLNTGMEIAQREGAEGVVSGKISPIGTGYVLTASMFAVHDGAELVKLSETARSGDDIIDAVDRLSKMLRERIGESIKSIRSNDDLDRVMTASLDALRLYSQGVKAEDVGNGQEAESFLLQAIQADSTFAMAYRKLSVVLGNAGQGFDRQLAAGRKAFELRDRLPERERLVTTAYYYQVLGDNKNALIANKAVLDRFPNETAALNNISIFLQTASRYEEAVGYLEHALELGNKTVYYINLFNSYIGLNRWDDAAALLVKFETDHPNHPYIPAAKFILQVEQGNIAGSDALIGSAKLSADPRWEKFDAFLGVVYAGLTGKVSTIPSLSERALKADLQRGALSQALEFASGRANILIEVQDEPETAQELLESALNEIPLDSLAKEDRPYARLAYTFALLGDVTEAERLLAEYRSMVEAAIWKGDFWYYPAAAVIQEQKGNLEGALIEFDKVATELDCPDCFFGIKGRFLEKLGRLDESEQAYEIELRTNVGFSSLGGLAYRPINWLNLAEVYSRNGKTDDAIEAYSTFIDMWSEADASLQPKVQYAKSRVERLLDQKAREPQQ